MSTSFARRAHRTGDLLLGWGAAFGKYNLLQPTQSLFPFLRSSLLPSLPISSVPLHTHVIELGLRLLGGGVSMFNVYIRGTPPAYFSLNINSLVHADLFLFIAA